MKRIDGEYQHWWATRLAFQLSAEYIFLMRMNGRKIVLDAGEDMENEQNICPICGDKIIEKIIDYSDWNDGHLLVVHEVPVRECHTNGHRFFQAKVAHSLERLFEADRQGQLQPVEIMEVPVVTLDLAA